MRLINLVILITSTMIAKFDQNSYNYFNKRDGFKL